MKNRFLIVFSLFFLSINTYAQKEEYFSNVLSDSIKMSKLEGIHFDISILSVQSTVPIIELGYFRELRISKSVGLIINAEVKNILCNRTYGYDMGSYHTDDTTTLIDGIQTALSIEPRWYYGYKTRFLKGRKTMLNSGWFVSLPICYNSGLMNDIRPPVHTGSLSYSTMLHMPSGILYGNNISISPQIGFRNALSDKIFMEASVRYSLVINTKKYYYSYESSNAPYLNLKVGYCF